MHLTDGNGRIMRSVPRHHYISYFYLLVFCVSTIFLLPAIWTCIVLQLICKLFVYYVIRGKTCELRGITCRRYFPGILDYLNDCNIVKNGKGLRKATVLLCAEHQNSHHAKSLDFELRGAPRLFINASYFGSFKKKSENISKVRNFTEFRGF